MIGLGVFMHCRRPSVRIGESAFGLTRDELFTALQAEGIASRKYFHPPLHRHDAYLPDTEHVSCQALFLHVYTVVTNDVLGHHRARPSHAPAYAPPRPHAARPRDALSSGRTNGAEGDSQPRTSSAGRRWCETPRVRTTHWW